MGSGVISKTGKETGGSMIFVTVSTGHFDPLVRACARLSHKYEFLGQIGSGTFVPPFPHFRTASPAEIEAKMSEAELVITHAGTGMLSTLYRIQKPCIVVPKQMRYGESNDGQVELAKKWADLKMGALCMDISNLETEIENFRSGAWTFPRLPSLGNGMRADLDL
jgi:UDP-N-acetylglucosamine transferase subunit ALG13